MIRIELSRMFKVLAISALIHSNVPAQGSVSDTLPSCYAGTWTYVATEHFIYKEKYFEGTVVITNDSIKIRKVYGNQIVENSYDSCIVDSIENECSRFSPLKGIRDMDDSLRIYSCDNPFYFEGDTLIQHDPRSTYGGSFDKYTRGVLSPVRRVHTAKMASPDSPVDEIYNLHGQIIKNGKIAGACLISKNQKLLKVLDLKPLR